MKELFQAVAELLGNVGVSIYHPYPFLQVRDNVAQTEWGWATGSFLWRSAVGSTEMDRKNLLHLMIPVEKVAGSSTHKWSPWLAHGFPMLSWRLENTSWLPTWWNMNESTPKPEAGPLNTKKKCFFTIYDVTIPLSKISRFDVKFATWRHIMTYNDIYMYIHVYI